MINIAVQYTLVGLFILAALAWILVKVLRKNKKGSGCCGCVLADSCQQTKQQKNEKSDCHDCCTSGKECNKHISAK